MNIAVVPSKLNNESVSLESKLLSRRAQIAIIGLGYVGLPLAASLAEASFHVTGIDLSDTKVKSINGGHSHISDVDDSRLCNVTDDKRLIATHDFKNLDDMDVVIICVPTPITQSKTPDLSYVINATKEVARHIHVGQLIILESTTHPGTTEEVVLPLLEKSGLVVGDNFFLAFSPERVDPCNKKYSLKNTPKVVGGVTQRCGAMAELLYASVAEQVHLVSSPKVAETTKLFENVFRNVNIALVNELTILCSKMGISACEVVEAAATKPFGFMRFNPGPGVGGHCIPVDPYYLAAKAKEYDFHSKFIESAGAVNENMPYFVVDQISEALNQRGKPTKNSRVLILGVAYKKDIDDVRETPAVRVIKTLKERGALVSYNDPYVPKLEVNGWSLQSRPLSKSLLSASDCAVIITDHSCYDYLDIVRHSQLVIDTRCATSGIKNHRNKIIRF